MGRMKGESKLDTKTARLKLQARQEPYWISMGIGEALGYYRAASGGAGSWWAKYRDGASGARRKKALGTADDLVEANGKVVLSYAQAQTQARAWFDQARHEATGEHLHTGPFTVKDAWEFYIADADRRGMKSVDSTRMSAERHILPALGAIPVEKLTLARIEKWHAALAASAPCVRTKAGAETPSARELPKTDEDKRARKSTANRVLTILKAALNHAKKRRMTLATGDAWREARPFKGVVAARIRFLSPEEAQRLVNACPRDFRRLVTAALHTGARYGGLIRMEVRDFNPTSGTVQLKDKTEKPRHVVLNEEGQAFFEGVCAGRRPEERIFLRENVVRRKHVGPQADHWARGDQFHLMAEASAAAGIGAVRFHELRHTYASMLVNAGVPLAFVAEQLGHSGTRMVEQHYGHLCPSAKAEAIRKLTPRLGLETLAEGSIRELIIWKG